SMGFTDEAIRILTAFPDNLDAYTVILNTLSSKRLSSTVGALAILGERKFLLKTADVDSLLSGDNLQVRLAVLRYIQATKSKQYLSIVSRYLSDADPEVSKQAQRTRQTIEGHDN